MGMGSYIGAALLTVLATILMTIRPTREIYSGNEYWKRPPLPTKRGKLD